MPPRGSWVAYLTGVLTAISPLLAPVRERMKQDQEGVELLAGLHAPSACSGVQQGRQPAVTIVALRGHSNMHN